MILAFASAPRRDPREWVVGIVSTVVASIGGGALTQGWPMCACELVGDAGELNKQTQEGAN